jgi:hypothetical protein
MFMVDGSFFSPGLLGGKVRCTPFAPPRSYKRTKLYVKRTTYTTGYSLV